MYENKPLVIELRARVAKALDERDITLTELARQINRNPSVVHDAMKGRSPGSIKVWADILEHLGDTPVPERFEPRIKPPPVTAPIPRGLPEPAAARYVRLRLAVAEAVHLLRMQQHQPHLAPEAPKRALEALEAASEPLRLAPRSGLSPEERKASQRANAARQRGPSSAAKDVGVEPLETIDIPTVDVSELTRPTE